MYDGQKIDSSIITGGTERFARLLYKYIPGIIPVHYTDDDAGKRRLPEMIAAAAAEHSADLILVNNASTTFTTTLQKYTSTPIALIVHILADSLSADAFLKAMERFSGHVAMVSDFQRENWERFADRRKRKRLTVSSIIPPAFIEHETYVTRNHVRDLVTVGRADQYKDPFTLSRRVYIQNKWNPSSTTSGLVLTTSNADKEYLDTSVAKFGPSAYRINLPHFDVLREISNSRVFLSTWPRETWGIGAMEAISFGLPVIAYHDATNHHASEVVVPKGFIRLTRKSCKGEEFAELMSDFRDMPHSARVRLMEEACAMHSEANFISKITTFLEKSY